jgi:hypothetical protein
VVYKCGGFLNRQRNISTDNGLLNRMLAGWASANCRGVVLYLTRGGARFTLTAEYALSAGANVTIDASRASSAVTLVSQSLYRHFYVIDATFSARNVIFAGGSSPGVATVNIHGGSIFATSSTLTLERCTFRQNVVRSTTGITDTFGGAIFLWTGAVARLTSCTFVDNGAYSSGGSAYGGAIHDFGSLTLSTCDFLRNAASGVSGFGGGVYAEWGLLQLQAPNFTANMATRAGGALYVNPAATVSLSRGFFSRNVNSFTPLDDVFNAGAISACTSTSNIVLESIGTGTCPVSGLHMCGCMYGTMDYRFIVVHPPCRERREAYECTMDTCMETIMCARNLIRLTTCS